MLEYHNNITQGLGKNPFTRMNAKEPCTIGKEITKKSRCLEAHKWASSLGLNTTVAYKMAFGTWAGVPYQCSAKLQNDVLHFSTNSDTDGSKLTNGEFVMICESGKNYSCTL